MAVRIPIESERITNENLLGVYRIFCEVYEIEPNRHDESRLIKHGVEELSESMGIHIRLSLYTKFFAQKVGKETEFKGSFRIEDPEQKERDEEFGERVNKYFQEQKKP